ncbi:uncharacterized protein LOC133200092 [Saccostrea echinata]|uniref:uncharacterized protein LOC133200092 n=1 Tax=Saccostrea echinata TaxID=191078 RepID=UPI002A81A8CD|nr:uncharacterized protein LOC133200092 [Saccostrea echinata]XP_061191823.1 uncharacterized protein LOC133200092 [Saccostrea echinata]
MRIFYNLFIKSAVCAPQLKTQGGQRNVTNDQSHNGSDINAAATVAQTKGQDTSENQIDGTEGKKKKINLHSAVLSCTAMGCFVTPFTKTFLVRIVENRVPFALSFYLLGTIFYIQSLYSYFGIKHPPLRLLYEDPKEYNRMDNENIKLLCSKVGYTLISLYQGITKKQEKLENESKKK